MTSAVTPLETVVLEDPGARAVVHLAPSRGGMVTRFSAFGAPVLYLDEATLLDTSKNVRGGNPVLFPSPGPLAGGRFERDGRAGAMKQHGVARQRPWSLVAAGAREATLRLASDASLLAEFPWAFELTFRYALDGARLRIEQRYANRDRTPMPFAAGFHPYFFVPQSDKARASIPTRATRAWDNVEKREIALEGPIDLTAREVDLHLVDHGTSAAALELGGGRRVAIAASDPFRRWVVWTLADRDFVCLEPWTAPANALNTGEGLLAVPPGAAVDLWTEIAVEVA